MARIAGPAGIATLVHALCGTFRDMSVVLIGRGGLSLSTLWHRQAVLGNVAGHTVDDLHHHELHRRQISTTYTDLNHFVFCTDNNLRPVMAPSWRKGRHLAMVGNYARLMRYTGRNPPI